MNFRFRTIFLTLTILALISFTPTTRGEWTSPYEQWENGPPKDQSYFPIGVWLQATTNSRIAAWKAAGMNIYIGLWQGPTSSQLNTLQANNMQVICSQNSTGLGYKNSKLSDGRPLIIAWQLEDEPDNHPKTPASTIQSQANSWRNNDSTRPIWLNLSQGMGNDGRTWVGQGGNIIPSIDYPAYIAATDIICFDIYPMSCSRSTTCDDAWRVAFGVDGLFQYAPGNQTVWNFVETGDINANGQKATPEEIKMEVWSAIIHGSRGIAYFIHGKSNASDFDEDALLQPENAENLAAVTAVNAQLSSLAVVINSTDLPNSAIVSSVQRSNTSVPIDYMVREHDGSEYIFAASMRDNGTNATFNLASQYAAGVMVEVIDEGRQIAIVNNAFTDTFTGYQAHLYKIKNTGVVGKYLFYNNSSFDGNDPAANTADDAAIAVDKIALIPGQTAEFIHYSSYSKGINGIMIDTADMPGQVSAADFEFKTGNDTNTAGWSAVSPVSITTRAGAGVGASDRITIIFADGEVAKKWLQVTVKATAATGLAADDVFYFGNAVGDTGDNADNAVVDASDEINCRNNPRHFAKPAYTDDHHDHNRDGRVDATDEIIARNNTTNFATALQLFVAP